MPAFVQEAIARADALTSLPISFSAAVTSGNKVFLNISVVDTISSVSGLGATWTRVVLTSADTNGTHLEVWQGDGPTGGTTITATPSVSTSCDMCASEWSGVGFVGSPAGVMVHATTVTTPAQHLYAIGDIEYASYTWAPGASVSYTDAPGAWTTLSTQTQNNLSEAIVHAYRTAAAASEDPTRIVAVDTFARPFKAASLILAAAAPPAPPPRLYLVQKAALVRAASW